MSSIDSPSSGVTRLCRLQAAVDLDHQHSRENDDASTILPPQRPPHLLGALQVTLKLSIERTPVVEQSPQERATSFSELRAPALDQGGQALTEGTLARGNRRALIRGDLPVLLGEHTNELLDSLARPGGGGEHAVPGVPLVEHLRGLLPALMGSEIRGPEPLLVEIGLEIVLQTHELLVPA